MVKPLIVVEYGSSSATIMSYPWKCLQMGVSLCFRIQPLTDMSPVGFDHLRYQEYIFCMVLRVRIPAIAPPHLAFLHASKPALLEKLTGKNLYPSKCIFLMGISQATYQYHLDTDISKSQTATFRQRKLFPQREAITANECRDIVG